MSPASKVWFDQIGPNQTTQENLSFSESLWHHCQLLGSSVIGCGILSLYCQNTDHRALIIVSKLPPSLDVETYYCKGVQNFIRHFLDIFITFFFNILKFYFQLHSQFCMDLKVFSLQYYCRLWSISQIFEIYFICFNLNNLDT